MQRIYFAVDCDNVVWAHTDDITKQLFYLNMVNRDTSLIDSDIDDVVMTTTITNDQHDELLQMFDEPSTADFLRATLSKSFE